MVSESDDDCNGCVYNTVSGCPTCVDCGVGENSRRVAYPDACQLANEAKIEELNQKLLSHAQNEHPHEYAELVEVLAREEKLKERVSALELLIPSMPCCPDGFMDEPCTTLKEALVVVWAARRWRKPAMSYAQRQQLDDDLTKAVDCLIGKEAE